MQSTNLNRRNSRRQILFNLRLGLLRISGEGKSRTKGLEWVSQFRMDGLGKRSIEVTMDDRYGDIIGGLVNFQRIMDWRNSIRNSFDIIPFSFTLPSVSWKLHRVSQIGCRLDLS